MKNVPALNDERIRARGRLVMRRAAGTLANLALCGLGVLLFPAACGTRDCAETLTCRSPAEDGGQAGEPPANGGKGGDSAGKGGSAGKGAGGSSGGKGSAGKGGGGTTPAGDAGMAGEGGGEGGESGAPGRGGTGGASGGGAGGAGAGGAPGRCDPEKEFPLPVYVPSFSSRPTAEATMTGDGLNLIVWEGDTFARATRATADGTFGTPVRDARMDVVSARQALSQGHELPNISADGLTFFAEFGGQANVYLHAAVRQSLDQDFPEATAIPEFASKVRRDPYPSFDGTQLYFIENGHIYYADKGVASYGTTIPLTTLDSPQGESNPVPVKGELVIYFATSRTDGTAKGGLDVWRSQRGAKDLDFDLPRAVDALNSERHERPIWVSADGCEIFLVRYIPDNLGGETPRLMSSRRPR